MAENEADTKQQRAKIERSLTREQCYLCIMRKNEEPPKQTKTPDELRIDHHDYLLDLERRGILFGAGPFRDGNGWAEGHGIGMIVIRAKDPRGGRGNGLPGTLHQGWLASHGGRALDAQRGDGQHPNPVCRRRSRG